MAVLNGIYIHVSDENVDRKMDISTHSVEVGSDITDHIKRTPTELSLSGEIVDFTGYTEQARADSSGITAWISLVKKDGSAFDTMSFSRLNDEILSFHGGANWVDTGAVQYVAENGELLPSAAGGDVAVSIVITNRARDTTYASGAGDYIIESDTTVTRLEAKVYAVKFEVSMPYMSTVRIQNAYKDYCCFNIINKSTTGYGIQDYNADADVCDTVLWNTYNGETGRIRTEFTNTEQIPPSQITPDIYRKAAWVKDKITSWLESGKLVTYEGRNYMGNYLITSFSTSHPNTITGGMSFDMVLKEFFSAKNGYIDPDAAVASGGTQQISVGDNSAVYYEVQEGDNIYDLLAAYNTLKREAIDGAEYTPIDWIMKMNPHAFADEYDCTTLKAYETIIMGYR